MLQRSQIRRLAQLICLAAMGYLPAYADTPKEIVGWVQRATVFPGALTLRARIDSGARTASINAQNIETFRRDGQRWVRFKVTNAKGKSAVFEQPEIGRVKVKRHGESPQTRPLISLRLCLGRIVKSTPVSLANRSGYNYQLLIGRDFLAGDFLIDPGATFLRPPRCGAADR